MAKLDLEGEKFTGWCSKEVYLGIASWWRKRWHSGSLGAGITLFFWEDWGDGS